MKLDEKPLGIPVEPALAHLVGVDLDERIMAAFFLHRELKGAKQTGESPRTRGMRVALERKRGKKSSATLSTSAGVSWVRKK